MTNHPTTSLLHAFETQIRHQVRAMYYSNFLHKTIKDYSRSIDAESYFVCCNPHEKYEFHVNLQILRDCWFHKMDELSTLIACEIISHIAYTEVAAYVLREDSTIQVWVGDHDLVIEVSIYHLENKG